MLVTYITKKENTTFIIVLMRLNRMAFILNFHFNKYETDIIKQGDSCSEIIICFATKFKLSVDHTLVESYNSFGIYLTSLA